MEGANEASLEEKAMPLILLRLCGFFACNWLLKDLDSNINST